MSSRIRRTRRPSRPSDPGRAEDIASQAGFSLTEMLVSLAMTAIIFGAFTGVLVTVQDSYGQQRERVRADESLRVAQHVIAQTIRSAGADPHQTGSTLVDPDPLDHGVFDNLRVVSDFHPADGDTDDALEDVLIHLEDETLYVRWVAGGVDQPLAYPVTDLNFEYYAADGTLLTAPSHVPGATRVRFSFVAPLQDGSGRTKRVESWVHMRNRK